MSLARARQQLVHAGVVPYEKPLNQVLGLDEPAPLSSSRAGELRSAGNILRAVLGSSGGGSN